jgi:hypothetical protein
MANELFQTGEEFAIRGIVQDSALNFNSTLEITLYNQSTDALTDSSLPAEITTEPTGSNYARETIALDTAEITTEQNTNSNYQFVFEDQTLITDDSTQSVDAYAVFVTFQSDLQGDSSTDEYLFFAGNLDQEYDLGQIDEFVLRGTGLALD